MRGPRSWSPGIFFAIDTIFLIVLLGAALLFATGAMPELHPDGRPGAMFLTVIPYWVPWAGALGGISISLVGVARYAGDRWDANRYGYWHLARPFLGGVFGTFAVLIVVLVLKTVTPQTIINTSVPYTPQGVAVLCVFAYVVGFREETFRDLVLKVVDDILGPGTLDKSAVIAFVPAALNLSLGPPAQQGAPAPVSGTVHVFNGSADSVHVAQTSIQCGDPSLSVDPIADTILAPAQALGTTIVWRPQGDNAALDSYVSVKADGRTAKLAVTGGQ
jgi:hypothetical protein